MVNYVVIYLFLILVMFLFNDPISNISSFHVYSWLMTESEDIHQIRSVGCYLPQRLYSFCKITL